ncbi:MAG: hypothetical protein HGA66_18120 [Holophaga sp.]|nr:hypothetical protein [Holophaga sp.]
MSWLDSQRSQEPSGDTALRAELRALLGMKPRNYFEFEPTPELIALADELRKEARRRNHTARRRSHWMLLAAALPLALAFGGVSLWGIAQKHKAEDLASAMVQKEAELNRMAASIKRVPAPGKAVQAQQPLLASERKQVRPATKGKELVIPIEQPAGVIPQDTQQVKAH